MLPIEAIAYTGSLWAAASATFYLFLPALGFALSYNSSPFAIALFYLVWAAIAAYIFREEYRSHMPGAQELWDDAVLSVLFGIGAGIFLWALSRLGLPEPHSIEPAFDLLRATPWYFLPKSVEILFQQLLIAALVFALARRFTLRTIIILYALLFGGAHLLLVFDGAFPQTVLTMLLAAVASSLVFPYLLLNVRRGFLYCYMIHWGFYAALVIALRIFA